MIQGGGFTADLDQKKTLPPIQNEAENMLKNERGSIAMAKLEVSMVGELDAPYRLKDSIEKLNGDFDAIIVDTTDKDIDQVLAIGPPIMMKACAETTRPHGVKTVVSLNPIMVDGTGMCGGCRESVEGKMKFGCVDGPDFDAHKVDFDELLMRLARFVPKEKEALEHWQKECRIQQEADRLVEQQSGS